ncbi:hypothetical protein [Prevotella sp. 885]|uniref:hypothetical protein n=1 Tax=Prevotella sp. 885 TaxID=2022527 RepID=UPI000BA052BB|nr:hypothetical protein [Prevotella sp. 885]OZT04238.1 hypothetical protein CHL74_06245 [Prevotella sp. 885]
MKKIFQYIMLAVVTIVMASCTSDIEETTATTGKSNVQLVVGEFPAFGDSQTRAIGTPDEGKTSWAEGDELLLKMTSKTLGTKYAAFKYNGSNWELASGELSYKEDEVPTFPHVYYAPNYKWEAGKLVLKEGKAAGTDEYIEGKANITPNGQGINVSFADATRNYSRLRIATNQDGSVTVIAKFITPANTRGYSDNTYTLTPDEKGNVYLYGKFFKYSSIIVKNADVTLVDYFFQKEIETNKSYVLDATVVSLVGLSTEEIQSTIKNELNKGKADIRLVLSDDMTNDDMDAIKSALEYAKDDNINLTIMGLKKVGNINEPQLLVTVSDPTMLTKLKNAIKMMNGVSSISIMRPKKTGLELAEEDKAKGRVTQWNSVDEMFDTVLGE